MPFKYPSVTQDPRFEAGRALIQQGMAHDGAIEIFSTLLEECIAKHGESSIETSPAFYEYGNALLRAALAASKTEEEPSEDKYVRNAAGTAAEARLQAQHELADGKPAAVPAEEDTKTKLEESETSENPEAEAVEDDDSSDDLNLSLEMMENAYSIMDEYQQTTKTSSSDYKEWVLDQIPRVLLGIGDCLSALQRHADAADTFSRALECRQKQLDEIRNETNNSSLEELQCQRRICEATILVAEELLACPGSDDVITTETNTLIVKKEERIEYARGYYDKARDSLQDTVFLLGKLASQKKELGTAKEDVCFLATIVMGVGERLAEMDEQKGESTKAKRPAKKAKLDE